MIDEVLNRTETPLTPVIAPDNSTMVKVYRALGEPTRLLIVQLLAGHDELTCSEMCERLGVTPSTLSHHLALLSDCGLLAHRKDGTFHRFRLRRDHLQHFAPAASDR